MERQERVIECHDHDHELLALISVDGIIFEPSQHRLIGDPVDTEPGWLPDSTFQEGTVQFAKVRPDLWHCIKSLDRLAFALCI